MIIIMITSTQSFYPIRNQGYLGYNEETSTLTACESLRAD